MVRQWKLKKPDIVISIQGGLKNFHLDPHHKEIFNRGLIKAAKTTNCGAWILTGKTHFNGVVACEQKYAEIIFTFVRIVDEMKLMFESLHSGSRCLKSRLCMVAKINKGH